MDKGDQNNDAVTGKPELPRFLRIVCILSFVHGGLFILKHIISVFEGYNTAEIERLIENVAKTSPVSVDQINEYYWVWAENFSVHELTNAVLYLMGLIGVYEMYRMRKRGFFMYGVAHIVLTFYPVTMVVNNDYAVIETIRWGVVTALFLIFYALNLKHMRLA